jgi:hypothetical protein
VKRFLTALNEWRGYVIAVLFFVGIAAILGQKLRLMWEMEDHLQSIRTDLRARVVADSILAAKNARLDYELRDYMCQQMGLRNRECPHFEGRVVILVDPGVTAAVPAE